MLLQLLVLLSIISTLQASNLWYYVLKSTRFIMHKNWFEVLLPPLLLLIEFLCRRNMFRQYKFALSAIKMIYCVLNLKFSFGNL